MKVIPGVHGPRSVSYSIAWKLQKVKIRAEQTTSIPTPLSKGGFDSQLDEQKYLLLSLVSLELMSDFGSFLPLTTHSLQFLRKTGPIPYATPRGRACRRSRNLVPTRLVTPPGGHQGQGTQSRSV